MGQKFSKLSDKHIEFIQQQKLYFVATAAGEGSVNLSPKGGDSLRVIDENTIAWQNLTGSGNESASHVLLNPRMTLMFCAFEGAPLILRTYGEATVLHQLDDEWKQYVDLFPPSNGMRQIFIQKIHTVQTSCGKSVPYFDYVSDRDDLANWAEKQGKDGIERYWVKKNQTSIDGFDTEIVKRTGITTD
ncbi:pyridoxamine 5'-phosphate oxidase family protein [Vibrio sp. S4M6]|uniref:pyridoxamine 5'-phosphate oxidase family protein n=1 Tax=Vibrio sinus TaxID=2946865 RepID=UPI00202A32EA|nr:pyridoxamine 5'-phosphate oxidase family protein [Vibrio sinus]MCL9780049.1 pyridoxamine 5'-phosphate oxidase family protein [Vibrio sinus]